MYTAIDFVNKMSADGCEPDITTYNIWIHGLCRSRVMSRAVKMLDELIPMGVDPNTVTYNTILNGICNDVLDRALILTGKFIKMAFVPNVVTICTLLSHFCKQGMAERALMWCQKLSDVPIVFDDVTYNILERAYRDMLEDVKIDRRISEKGQLFEFLMYIIVEYLCSYKLSNCRSTRLAQIVELSLSMSSDDMQVDSICR
eukprot:TRINITY_DN11122_c0_g2_i3.p1 TRINITY_DN11122_c0_g2~~TRINITY_DN11122_c0_g2_i3.p1  ORF type:complete len:201 (+),score=27.13 TRINITY_DN11122_c0_g2_i3:197-799(+)